MDFTEPPKPITRLAEPLDRTGPRAPSREGRRALAGASLGMGLCMGGWLFLAGSFLIGAGIAPVFLVIPILLAVGGGIALAAIPAAIIALTRAVDRHLLRIEALAALIVGVLALIAAAGPFLVPDLLGSWFALPIFLGAWFILVALTERIRW